MKKYVLFLFVVYSLSCSSRPKVSYSKRATNLYWYGNGTSIIDKTDYREAARNRALSAIASQLEVEIKSNITDMQEAYGVGLNATVNEYNRVVTESRINTNLRNIEYIDEYEKKGRYYISARLNKQNYLREVEQKKTEALNKTEELLINSIKSISTNSLSNISIAIESIFPFLDYFPKIQNPLKNGDEEYVMNIAEQMVRMYNDDLEVSFSPKTVNTKAFVENNKRVIIKVKSKSEIASVSNLRLLVRLNEKDNNEFIMLDKNGQAEYKLGRMEVPVGNHSLFFSLDYQSMMTEKALELVNVIPREYSLEISLEAPKIYFDGNVLNLGNKVKNSPIYSSLKECLEDNYSSVLVNSKR